MHRIGFKGVYNSESIKIPGNSSLEHWNFISIVDELKKFEVWSNKIVSNLVLRGDIKKQKSKDKMFIWVLIIFLWFFTLRGIFCQILIKDTEVDLLLVFGDLASFYGIFINRLYFNTFVICWGFHASVIYTLIVRHSGEEREWLRKFEDGWQKTNFRAQSFGDNQKYIVRVRLVCTYVLKSSVVLFMILLMTASVFGVRHSFRSMDTSLYIYFVWTIIYGFWCIISTVINLTALFHHYIICLAIILRFGETNSDLDYAIEKRPLIDPWVISRLLTKHYTTCDMVNQSNRYLKNYLFIFYAIFLPHSCFLVYQMIFANTSVEVKVVVGIYICVDALQIVSVSLTSAKITANALKPYHVVHGMARKSLPNEIQMQVSLFLQRLSGTAIGLTVLDSFVITGGVISSICTALITYFSIIIEMN